MKIKNSTADTSAKTPADVTETSINSKLYSIAVGFYTLLIGTFSLPDVKKPTEFSLDNSDSSFRRAGEINLLLPTLEKAIEEQLQALSKSERDIVVHQLLLFVYLLKSQNVIQNRYAPNNDHLLSRYQYLFSYVKNRLISFILPPSDSESYHLLMDYQLFTTVQHQINWILHHLTLDITNKSSTTEKYLQDYISLKKYHSDYESQLPRIKSLILSMVNRENKIPQASPLHSELTEGSYALLSQEIHYSTRMADLYVEYGNIEAATHEIEKSELLRNELYRLLIISPMIAKSYTICTTASDKQNPLKPSELQDSINSVKNKIKLATIVSLAVFNTIQKNVQRLKQAFNENIKSEMSDLTPYSATGKNIYPNFYENIILFKTNEISSFLSRVRRAIKRKNALEVNNCLIFARNLHPAFATLDPDKQVKNVQSSLEWIIQLCTETIHVLGETIIPFDINNKIENDIEFLLLSLKGEAKNERGTQVKSLSNKIRDFFLQYSPPYHHLIYQYLCEALMRKQPYTMASQHRSYSDYLQHFYLTCYIYDNLFEMLHENDATKTYAFDLSLCLYIAIQQLLLNKPAKEGKEQGRIPEEKDRLLFIETQRIFEDYEKFYLIFKNQRDMLLADHVDNPHLSQISSEYLLTHFHYIEHMHFYIMTIIGHRYYEVGNISLAFELLNKAKTHRQMLIELTEANHTVKQSEQYCYNKKYYPTAGETNVCLHLMDMTIGEVTAIVESRTKLISYLNDMVVSTLLPESLKAYQNQVPNISQFKIDISRFPKDITLYQLFTVRIEQDIAHLLNTLRSNNTSLKQYTYHLKRTMEFLNKFYLDDDSQIILKTINDIFIEANHALSLPPSPPKKKIPSKNDNDNKKPNKEIIDIDNNQTAPSNNDTIKKNNLPTTNGSPNNKLSSLSTLTYSASTSTSTSSLTLSTSSASTSTSSSDNINKLTNNKNTTNASAKNMKKSKPKKFIPAFMRKYGNAIKNNNAEKAEAASDSDYDDDSHCNNDVSSTDLQDSNSHYSEAHVSSNSDSLTKTKENSSDLDMATMTNAMEKLSVDYASNPVDFDNPLMQYTPLAYKIIIPPHAKEFIQKIYQTGYYAYIYGGYSRDMLGRQLGWNIFPHDIDIITNCPIPKLKELFPFFYPTSKDWMIRIKAKRFNTSASDASNSSQNDSSILSKEDYLLEKELLKLDIDISSCQSPILDKLNQFALSIDTFLVDRNGHIFDPMNNFQAFMKKNFYVNSCPSNNYSINPDVFVRLLIQTHRFGKTLSDKNMAVLFSEQQQLLNYVTKLSFNDYNNKISKLFSTPYANEMTLLFWESQAFWQLHPNPALCSQTFNNLYKIYSLSAFYQSYFLNFDKKYPHILLEHQIMALLIFPIALQTNIEDAIASFFNPFKELKRDPDYNARVKILARLLSFYQSELRPKSLIFSHAQQKATSSHSNTLQASQQTHLGPLPATTATSSKAVDTLKH